MIENDVHIAAIYADTSVELSEIERFGVAYEEYVRGMAKRIADSMKPLVEGYSQIVKSIDFSGVILSFQESMKHIGKIISESMSGINNMAKLIANSMEPFQRISETIEKALSSFHFPNITEEEIDEWKINYKRWGELGWTVLPNASFNLFKVFPNDETTAHKTAMSYCDKEAMGYIFSELADKKTKRKTWNQQFFAITIGSIRPVHCYCLVLLIQN